MYANFGTSITIIDRKLKEKDLLEVYIYIIAISVRVWGIRNDIYETKEYIVYEIYLSKGKDKKERLVIVKIALREIYLVDDLAVGILIRNNILVLEGINLLFLK